MLLCDPQANSVALWSVQLQSLVVDESSQECLDMFQEEQKKGAAGGACSQAAHNLAAEMAYQRRAEQALAEENCYKIYIVSTPLRVLQCTVYGERLLVT